MLALKTPLRDVSRNLTQVLCTTARCYVHSGASATDTDKAGMSTENAGKIGGGQQRSVHGLIQEATAHFRTLPYAYVNISPDDITFRVGRDYKGNTCPEIFYQNRKMHSGLTHVTPWAAVYFARLGYKGNLGEIIYDTNQLREKPAEASQDIALSVSPRHINEEINADMLEYLEWLHVLEAKLCTHIVEHIISYPRIRARYGGKYEPEILKEIIRSSLVHKVERHKVTSEGEPIEGTQFLHSSQKMFYKSKTIPNRFDSKYDEEIYQQHGLVRRKIPIYDSAQNELPQMDAPVRWNDVVSCTLRVEPIMYEHMFGLKRSISSVTILCQADRPIKQAETSPYMGASVQSDTKATASGEEE
eukprot:comp24263_c9_seq1/m.45115 comp24263_c9_seq1/g.45115  ORF comp24263_c9_seq1/g.45115 comp24263_c9_seq1/m.45115 type:complete len:359 (-) comp24263_c9_seq1:172-1248(-)